MTVSVRSFSSALNSAGLSVSAVGDFNGDGFEDFIIGAPHGGDETGGAYLIYGAADGLPATSDLDTLTAAQGFAITGATVDDLLGLRVAAAGDVNGDGFDDVILSAPGASPDYIYTYTRVDGYTRFYTEFISNTYTYIYTGYTANGATYTTERTYVGGYTSFTSYYYGTSIQYTYDLQRPDAGVSYIIFGTDQMPVEVSTATDSALFPGALVLGELPLDKSGQDLSGVGDFNGDGIDDVAIGSPDAGDLGLGRVFVLFGDAALGDAIDPQDTGSADALVLTTDQTDSAFGESVAGGFDIDGDGLADIVVGARYAEGTYSYSTPPYAYGERQVPEGGQAYVFFGTATPSAVPLKAEDLDGTNGFSFSGAASGDRLGDEVEIVRDLNGDGLADVLISATGAWNSRWGGYGGEIYVVFGGATQGKANLSRFDYFTGGPQLGFLVSNDRFGTELGRTLEGVGDVNGDGLSDFMVADKIRDSNTGRAHLIFGSATPGFDIAVEEIDGSNGFTFTAQGPGQATNFATSFSGGDFDGDGRGDILIGSGGETGPNETLLISGGASVLGVLDRLDGAGDGTIDTRKLADAMLVGTKGGDLITATDADTMILGLRGFDRLTGGTGDDKLIGGGGRDDLFGDDGKDRLKGGTGDDRMRGGDGADRLFGGLGDDRLRGNRGDDDIGGGAGDDDLVGGKGDDVLNDGAGVDLLTGGAGADIFVFVADGEADAVADFQEGLDLIDITAWGATANTLFFAYQVDGTVIVSFGAEVLTVTGDRGTDLSSLFFHSDDFLF